MKSRPRTGRPIQGRPPGGVEAPETEPRVTGPAAGASVKREAAGDLVLPGSISETALNLPAGLSFAEWEQAGEKLGRIGRACQWWIGDWLNYGERAYGEKYAQAIEVTGYEEKTLRNLAWVASHVEMSRRRDILSWRHHAEVAALSPPDQEGNLEQAEAEGWSVAELRKQIKGEVPDDAERCPTCGHRLPKGAQVRTPRNRKGH